MFSQRFFSLLSGSKKKSPSLIRLHLSSYVLRSFPSIIAFHKMALWCGLSTISKYHRWRGVFPSYPHSSITPMRAAMCKIRPSWPGFSSRSHESWMPLYRKRTPFSHTPYKYINMLLFPPIMPHSLPYSCAPFDWPSVFKNVHSILLFYSIHQSARASQSPTPARAQIHCPATSYYGLLTKCMVVTDRHKFSSLWTVHFEKIAAVCCDAT